MNKHFFVSVAITLFVATLSAQNSKVTSGVIAFDSGKYDEAVSKLEEAVASPELLKGKNLPKAHFYLSQTYLRIAQDTALSVKYPEALDKAFANYEKAKEVDTEGSLKAMLPLVEQNLWPVSFNKGAEAYNKDNYPASKNYFEKAISVSPQDYQSYLMLGFSNWMMKDSTSALDALQKTVEFYQKSTPEQPNTNVSKAYLIIATIQDARKNPQAALETLEQGSKAFPTDPDLGRTALGIYQKNPSLFTQAQEKFETAIKNDPEDLPVKLAYANILEQNGKVEQADALYMDVLKRDPDNVNANIKLGAKYINSAAEISQSKMKLTKDADIDKANEQIKELMRKAEPYMIKLHKLEPDETEWINQLVSIAYILDYPEDKIAELEKAASAANKKKAGN